MRARPIDAGRIVREGYDRLDTTYRDWVARMPGDARTAFLEEVLRLVRPGADVLEIGCGPGTDAAALADRRNYTGIDLSAVQLAHARARVPNATLIHGDVFDVDLPRAGFDAAVALYVFNHITAARLPELFERIASWLRPGGWLCASFGVSDDPGTIERSWLGVADMYFSSVPPDRNDALLRSAGFEIRSAKTITEVEPDEGPVTFRWVTAQREPGGDEG